MPTSEPTIETPAQIFEREVSAPIRRAMQLAMIDAHSREEAKQVVEAALPKDRSFLGPLVMYMETATKDGGKRRFIKAMVQTLNVQMQPVDIEAEYIDTF